jgi:hypothetical protein
LDLSKEPLDEPAIDGECRCEHTRVARVPQMETLILTRAARGSAGPVPRRFWEATSGAGPGGEGYGRCTFTLITHTLVDLDFLRMKLTQFRLAKLEG